MDTLAGSLMNTFFTVLSLLLGLCLGSCPLCILMLCPFCHIAFDVLLWLSRFLVVALIWRFWWLLFHNSIITALFSVVMCELHSHSSVVNMCRNISCYPLTESGTVWLLLHTASHIEQYGKLLKVFFYKIKFKGCLQYHTILTWILQLHLEGPWLKESINYSEAGSVGTIYWYLCYPSRPHHTLA